MTAHRPKRESEIESLDAAADDPGRDDAGRTVATLTAELAELEDQLLRAVAEQENVRKRAERDRDAGIRFAASGFARDLLPTADNLRRAIECLPDDAEMDEGTQRLRDGVLAIERSLLEAFAKHGIRRLDPLGKPFDPTYHQAMSQVAGSGQPAWTVVRVLQPGYVHHDRVLQPALVEVAADGSGGSGPA